MSKRIITISRQFGSNGRIIGKLLSSRLRIPFYDKQLIKLASEQLDIPYEQLVLVDEKKEKSWRYEVDRDSRLNKQYRYDSIDRQLFETESEVIKELARREDCIIVGRCADYVLKDLDKMKHVYLYAPYEVRVKRVMEREGLEEKEAEKLVRQVDKDRRYYYNYYTNGAWDEMENYDICLNTHDFNTEEILEILEKVYRLL